MRQTRRGCIILGYVIFLFSYGGGLLGTTRAATPSVVEGSEYPANGAEVFSGEQSQLLQIALTNADRCIFHFGTDSSAVASLIGTIKGEYCEVRTFYDGINMTDNGTNYWYVEAENTAETTRYPTSGTLSFTVVTKPVPWTLFLVPTLAANKKIPVTTNSSGLNDTGIIWGGGTVSGNNSTCTPGVQDCSSGRDNTDNYDTDGHAGFSFTKLDSSGAALADQAQDYATNPWSCVKDEVTGLIWAVKTTTGLHDSTYTYSWYNTDAATNGGADGTQNPFFGSCDDNHDCNTTSYVDWVNSQGLCGATDWRVPSVKELLSIVSYNAAGTTAIDSTFFPNTATDRTFWTSTPVSEASTEAWSVHFQYGYTAKSAKSSTLYVRLVRTAPN